jgi:hypothetical protein
MRPRARGSLARLPAFGVLLAAAGALIAAGIFLLGPGAEHPESEGRAAFALAGENPSTAPSGADPAAADGPPGAVAREEFLPEAGVLVRVVDGVGAPQAHLPVALVVPRALPRGRLVALAPEPVVFGSDAARHRVTWDPRGSPEPHVADDRRALETRSSFGTEGKYAWIDEQLALDPPWPLDGEPRTLELHREPLGVAWTDARGEARLAWDRSSEPRVQVVFAFPALPTEVGELDANSAAVPARVELRAPELARLLVRATQDLEPASGARWRARIAMRPEQGNGRLRWLAWEAPRALEEGTEAEFLWERGLEVRLEAAVDAPLASMLLFPLASDAETSSLGLRAREHYSLLRGTLHNALGEPIGGIPLELRRAAPRARSPFVPVDRAALALDEQSRFTVWAPSAPRRIEAREHALYALDDAAHAVWREKLRRIELEGYPLEDRETYFELGAPDPAGFVRELGVLRLGYGPCLVAGRVLWESGEPVERPEVKLATRATSESSGDFDHLAVDRQGRFRRLGVPGPEPVELLVRAIGMTGPARFSIAAGRRDVELRLPHRGALLGRVVLDAWTPIAVFVRAANGEELSVVSRANGEFEVRGVPLGICTIELRSGRVVLRRLEGIELAESGTVRPEALREIDLRPHTQIVKLELRNEQRRIVKNRSLELVASARAFHWRGSTLDDGSCVVALPRGIERAELRVEGFREQELRLDRERIVVELSAVR